VTAKCTLNEHSYDIAISALSNPSMQVIRDTTEKLTPFFNHLIFHHAQKQIDELKKHENRRCLYIVVGISRVPTHLNAFYFVVEKIKRDVLQGRFSVFYPVINP